MALIKEADLILEIKNSEEEVALTQIIEAEVHSLEVEVKDKDLFLKMMREMNSEEKSEEVQQSLTPTEEEVEETENSAAEETIISEVIIEGAVALEELNIEGGIIMIILMNKKDSIKIMRISLMREDLTFPEGKSGMMMTIKLLLKKFLEMKIERKDKDLEVEAKMHIDIQIIFTMSLLLELEDLEVVIEVV